MSRMQWFSAAVLILASVLSSKATPQATSWPSASDSLRNCKYDLGFCHEAVIHSGYSTTYIGHDEPNIIFYSDMPGSGNSSVYLITLPHDPPTRPVQNGGGTYNFQLQPVWWVGMALCDSQSYPEYTHHCVPDTDANIFASADPYSRRFIGKHPGSAFMELQFASPSWVSSSLVYGLGYARSYFALLTIDSYNVNGATGVLNNVACQNSNAGIEPVNVAEVTRNGVPLAPPNPLGVNFGRNNPDVNNVLLMQPGDQILVIINDTQDGVATLLANLTSGQSGFMVASAANGFGQVLYQPKSATCNVAPYNFHPMYSSSNVHAVLPWGGSGGNIVYSSELGHFQFCDASDPTTLNCTVPGAQEGAGGLDADDAGCASPGGPYLPGPPYVQIGGCLGSDLDFDGQSYGLKWPGTFTDVHKDRALHPQPVRFTSPLFFGTDGKLHNFDRVKFETDIPLFDPKCDTTTGAGCKVPARGMRFYPFYTAGSAPDGSCRWQLGGAHIPGTTHSFGGTPTAAWGTLSKSLAEVSKYSAEEFITGFSRSLPNNPCTVAPADFLDQVAKTMGHVPL